MEQKTKVTAPEGKQEVLVTRDFDLPVDLLFKAYVEAEIVEQWMGTKVIKLDARKHGSYQYLTTDPKGNKHPFSGVIHELVTDKKMTRTFEMEAAPNVGIQLEFYEFVSITPDTSQLNMRILFETLEQRDFILKQPFVMGINWAHNRIQEVVSKLK